jgi:hypothetical protein
VVVDGEITVGRGAATILWVGKSFPERIERVKVSIQSRS